MGNTGIIGNGSFGIFGKIIVILSCAFCAAITHAQTNYTAISNLGQPASGQAPAFEMGMSFETGNAPAYLYTVFLSMVKTASAASQPITVTFCSDHSGVPGSPLGTLSGNSFPTNTAVYTYTNTSSLLLASNTTYWVVEIGRNFTFDWSLTTTNGLDAGSFWTLGSLKEFSTSGGGWVAYPETAYAQFSVAVTNPQLPSITISQPIVLTFPNPGFPAVLQQNPSLTTTNWVNATNATLSGVISNQSVYLLPPTSAHLNYRLELQ